MVSGCPGHPAGAASPYAENQSTGERRIGGPSGECRGTPPAAS